MKSPLGRLDVEAPPWYQDKLADLIRVEKPALVVETGLCTGFGAEYILQALDDNGNGCLYSIDPWPDKLFIENPIVHPRFAFIQQKSQEFLRGGECYIFFPDMFIHDSDHSKECQEFEYAWAWENVRPGGIIASDDTTWGNHGAWERFLAQHNITEQHEIGNARWIRRT